MLICDNCGKPISESDLSTHKEFISYCGEKEYYETYSDKCSCGGEFVEAKRCDACEEWTNERDLIYGYRYSIRICMCCADYYRKKYESVYNKSINGLQDFIDWLVDNGEIIEK